MPSHKSCAKRVKTSTQERIRNRAQRSVLRQAIKELRGETNKEAAQKKLSSVVSLLDRAAASNLIHKRNADRNKSRLAVFVSRLA